MGENFLVYGCIEPSWVLVVLKELELINFMSHERTKITFTQGLNVIVGRKGSGKTAILEAIRLAFGGLGRERLESLGKFVRHGANMAIIRLKLSNVVEIPGRPRIRLVEYLPDNADVVLERFIYSDGRSHFSINGRRVTKNDVIKMLARINISPRNTLFFLPQERVNAWVSLTTRERVDLLFSVLGLKELRDRLERVRVELKEKEKVRKSLLEMLSRLEEQIMVKERSIVSPAIAKDKLIRYYAVKIAYLVSRRSELESQLKSYRKKLEEIEEEIVQNEELRKKLDSERESLEREFESIEYKIQDILKKKTGYEFELKKAEEKIREAQVKLIEIKEKHEKELKELEEIRKEWGSSEKEELEKLKNEKINMIDWIESKLEMDEHFRHIRALQEEMERRAAEKKSLQKELEELRSRIRDILGELDKSGALEKIFNHIPRELLGSEIYGPIVLEIKPAISEIKYRDYAIVVENLLGRRLLSSFVVTSRRAYNILVNIIRRLGTSGRIDIITLSFSDTDELVSDESLLIAKRIINEARKKRNTLKRKLREVLGKREFLVAGWVCDIITAPDPVLAVIESRNWNVPIVLDEKAAAIVLNRLDLSRAVTIDGSTIERRKSIIGNSIFYTVRLGSEADKESLLLAVSGLSLEEFFKAEAEIISKIELLDSEIKRLKQEMEFLQRSLPARTRELIQEKIVIEEEIRKLDSIIARIDAIHRRLEQAPERIKSIQQSIEAWRKRVDELQDKLEEYDKEIARLREQEGFLKERIREILDQEAEVLAKIKSLEREREELPARIRFLEREISSIDDELSKTKNEMAVIIDILRKIGIFPRNLETQEIIKKEVISKANNLIEAMEIEELNKRLMELEESVRSYKESILKAETKAMEIEALLENIRNIKKRIRELDREIEEIRKLYWEEHKELIDSIRQMIKRADKIYKRLLSLVNARGEIALRGDSPDKLEFAITIDLHRREPIEIDKGGFSSGEKTTAIMLMIIALFLTAPAPIYMFDEFDVFLDDKSLREMMLIIKKFLGEFQGIITTTHREEILEAADKILYIQYDEKEQKSITLEMNIRDLKTLGKIG
ncbi:MAG: AAA family ATPase [Candidatus Njordarchaeales archaeon]